MFHLIPVSVNFALLGLYVREVLWTPPWPTTNILNTLQFAAKVHETLMIASLASILLHHIRYKLLSSSQGVPLGLATSPFRLLDLTYLWSQEFSAAWSSEQGIRIVVSVVFHVYLFVLAAILGPASAISMLPRLGDWEIAGAVAKAPFKAVDLQLYVGGRLSDIYPQRITSSFIPEACDYGNLSQPQTNTCPRHGLEDILSGWLPVNMDTPQPYSAWYVLENINITVQRNENLALPPRTITLGSRIPNTTGGHEIVMDATTSPDSILRFTNLMMKYYYSLWGSTETIYGGVDGFLPTQDQPAKLTLYPGQLQPGQSPSSWKQPFVSSSCSMQSDDIDESGSLSFAFSQCLESNCGPKYMVSLDSRSLPTTFNDTEMGFVNISNLEITPSFTPSAAFIYTHGPNTTLCLIKAHWIDFTIANSIPWFSSSDMSWMWQRPDPDWIARGGNWFSETNPTQIIHLDLEWLIALDSGTGREHKSDDSFSERLRQACLDWLGPKGNTLDRSGKQLSNACMAFGLALGVTEGLSKIPYNFDIHVLGTDSYRGSLFGPSSTLSSWTDMDRRPASPYSDIFQANWTPSTLSTSEIRETSTRLDFTISERLYGYRFNSVTIILAFIALFLYVATVFLHILIMSSGTSWSSRAWTSLGEFLVLAIQSPVPHSVLDNTGGGVRSASTWKARASVQELQGSKRVGITVEEPGRSEAETRSVSKVRPDWKYS